MKIFFLLSFISIISCNGQTNKDTNMLDLDYLKKNGNVSSISYNGAVSIPEDNKSSVKHYKLSEIKNNIKIITEGDEEIGFSRTINDTDYITITEFDGKGFPKKSEKKSTYGFYVNQLEYDQKGNPSKEINYDLLFKFKAKDILNYMKNNDFNLDKKYYQNILSSEVPPPTILRGTADEFKLLIPELKLNNEFVWIISNVEGSYKGNKGIYLLCLDGNTGKELLVKKYLGKKSGKNGIGTYPNYETILVSK